MKILDILVNEDFSNDDMGDGNTDKFSLGNISVADLNSLQLRTLNRLKDGIVTIDDASEKELDIIMDLIDIGLVDSDGNVTDAGMEAVDEPDINNKINPSSIDSDDMDVDGFNSDDDIDNDDDDDIDFTSFRRNNNSF